MNLILEDKLEIGDNITGPIESKGQLDINYQCDLNPISRKLITMTGNEREIIKQYNLNGDSYSEHLDLTKLNEETYLACISGRIPLKKLLHNLLHSSSLRQSAIPNEDMFMMDYTDSSSDED